jgi:hypothetical protein
MKKLYSGGVDVLIGTPNKLGEMFTTAGFNKQVENVYY